MPGKVYPHSQEQSSRQVTLPYMPELSDNRPIEDIISPPVARPRPTKSQVQHPFVDALKAAANLTLTENRSPAFVSTKSACLDAFATIDGNTWGGDIHRLLASSWEEDPNMTLRVIWNLRSIHDGKAAKYKFYHAFGWLYLKHPKTAITNLSQLVEPVIERMPKKGEEKPQRDNAVPREDRGGLSHGYYKDLLNILALAVTDQLTDPDSTFPAIQPPRACSPRCHEGRSVGFKCHHGARKNEAKYDNAEKKEPSNVNDNNSALTRKLQRNQKFRALYVAVARIFAASLAKDMRILETLNSLSSDGQARPRTTVSLASKWAPSLDGSHDRLTNIATAISIVMYASGAFKDLAGIPMERALVQKDAQKLRGYYRRWIISPLRKHLKIPEVLMSTNQWQAIDYSRVPSICFDKNKVHFFIHDQNRLVNFVQKVSEGERTISGATIAPHELVRQAAAKSYVKRERRLNRMMAKIADIQWNTLVENLRSSGGLDNSLAVCDVSGSMGPIHGYKRDTDPTTRVMPIFPAIALSLLVAQLAIPPFSNIFITFSKNPSIVTLRPDASLTELVAEMSKADWAMNTDFNAVFLDLILPMAIRDNLRKEDMIKRLFVFSDMQFDQANPQPQAWETNHERIDKEFKAAGYEMPEIVYWNLAGNSAAKPVTKNTPGVAMLSGFSGNLLKIFMEDESTEGEDDWCEVIHRKMDPVTIMRRAHELKSYARLKVID